MKRIIYILFAILLLLPMASCRKVVGPTHLSVQRPIRHYRPIVQGKDLHQSWIIVNEGPSVFVFDEVLPDCSAVELLNEPPKILNVGDSVDLKFVFHAKKSIGYVRHQIRVYGNAQPDGEFVLDFDLHIVRPSMDKADAEENIDNELTVLEQIDLYSASEKDYY